MPYWRWLIFPQASESVTEILLYRSLRALHIKIMASTVQFAITSVQMTNYVTRMLLNLGTFRLLILLSFLVATLIAVGYDYSKQ